MGYIPEPAYFDLSAGFCRHGVARSARHRQRALPSLARHRRDSSRLHHPVRNLRRGPGPVGCNEHRQLLWSLPGQSDMATFAFDAPLTPGRYRVYSGLTLQFGCDGTMAGGPDIGEIFVQ